MGEKPAETSFLYKYQLLTAQSALQVMLTSCYPRNPTLPSVLFTLNLHLAALSLASASRLGRACSTDLSSCTVGTSWQEAAQCHSVCP